MTGEFHLRLARPGEEDAIVQFLDAHWEWKLPLVHVPQFFEFYYRPFGGAPQFALALQDGRICAAAGFIRANAGENPDIWASIWAADEAAPGAGMELMAALPRLANARFCAVNNIRKKVVGLYRFLGYDAGRLPHYYRLAAQSGHRVARVAAPRILPLPETGLALRRVRVPMGVIAIIYESRPNVTSDAAALCLFKDYWYLSRRYFAYPFQSYDVWASETGEHLLCTRTVPVNGTNVLRLVDYVGEPGQFWLLGRAIDGLLHEAKAEYAECYCAGVAPECMEQAGFCARGPKDEAVIPNYLTPPLYENTEYYYAAQPGGAVLMCKADGDQDRPNLPAP